MKKTFIILLITILLISLFSCNGNKHIKERKTQNNKILTTEQVDIDLSQLSLPVVYGQIFNITLNSDDYIGKTIKIKGIFDLFQDPNNNEVYCSIIIPDEQACCMQGFGIKFKSEYKFPKDFPKDDDTVTLIGRYEIEPNSSAGYLVDVTITK